MTRLTYPAGSVVAGTDWGPSGMSVEKWLVCTWGLLVWSGGKNSQNDWQSGMKTGQWSAVDGTGSGSQSQGAGLGTPHTHHCCSDPILHSARV